MYDCHDVLWIDGAAGDLEKFCGIPRHGLAGLYKEADERFNFLVQNLMEPFQNNLLNFLRDRREIKPIADDDSPVYFGTAP